MEVASDHFIQVFSSRGWEGLLSLFINGAWRHKVPESVGRNMLDKCFSLENVYLSDMIPFMLCVWECIHFSKTL